MPLISPWIATLAVVFSWSVDAAFTPRVVVSSTDICTAKLAAGEFDLVRTTLWTASAFDHLPVFSADGRHFGVLSLDTASLYSCDTGQLESSAVVGSEEWMLAVSETEVLTASRTSDRAPYRVKAWSWRDSSQGPHWWTGERFHQSQPAFQFHLGNRSAVTWARGSYEVRFSQSKFIDLRTYFKGRGLLEVHHIDWLKSFVVYDESDPFQKSPPRLVRLTDDQRIEWVRPLQGIVEGPHPEHLRPVSKAERAHHQLLGRTIQTGEDDGLTWVRQLMNEPTYTDLGVSADGRLSFVGFVRGETNPLRRVLVFSNVNGQQVMSLKVDSEVLKVQISPNGQVIAVAHAQGISLFRRGPGVVDPFATIAQVVESEFHNQSDFVFIDDLTLVGYFMSSRVERLDFRIHDTNDDGSTKNATSNFP